MMLRHSVSFAALGAALAFAAPAMAQQATADDHVSKPDAADATPADGDILVTGTRILRPNIASAAPITTVTAQDIRAQSPTNIEEVLNRLPQIAPDSQQNYQDSDGRQRIKLRSLGFERTLVLVDGRHGPKDVDREMMTMLDEAAVGYRVVLTKADKMKASELAKVIEGTEVEARKHVAAFPEVHVTSAEKGMGIGELRAAVLGDAGV